MRLPKSMHLLGMFAGVVSTSAVGVGSQLPSQLGQPSAELNLPPQGRLRSNPQWEVSVEFRPPVPDRDPPVSTAGGGVRLVEIPPEENPRLFESDEPLESFCSEWGKTPLTALMPANNRGTTVNARPTLFWYLPKSIARSAELVIVDENRNKVYQTTIAVPSNPGIVQLRLPTTVSLEVGKTYLWELALICEPENRGVDEFVQGEIQRVPLDAALEETLARSDALERAQLYARASIWHETVNTLAQLRNSHPGEWEQLLRSVGLAAISSQPLVPCCTAPD